MRIFSVLYINYDNGTSWYRTILEFFKIFDELLNNYTHANNKAKNDQDRRSDPGYRFHAAMFYALSLILTTSSNHNLLDFQPMTRV